MSFSQQCPFSNELHHHTQRSLVVIENGVTYTKYFDQEGCICRVEVEETKNDNELKKIVRTVKGFWKW